MKKILAITSLSLFANLTIASPNLKEATNDVCHCLEEPHNKVSEAMELIKKAQAIGDMSQMMAAQGDMMSVFNASSRCFELLPKKYPEIDKNAVLQEQVMNMAEEQCPNPASEMLKQR